MALRGPYRRHSPQFKIQICSDIRSGKIGRREALKTHNLSANLMQMWLGSLIAVSWMQKMLLRRRLQSTKHILPRWNGR